LLSLSSLLSFLLWCCCLYGYWHVNTQRDQSTSNCCIATIIGFIVIIVVTVDFIAHIAVSVIANRTCQCLALLLLSAQGKQTSRHLCPLCHCWWHHHQLCCHHQHCHCYHCHHCCCELVLLQAEKERRVDW